MRELHRDLPDPNHGHGAGGKGPGDNVEVTQNAVENHANHQQGSQSLNDDGEDSDGPPILCDSDSEEESVLNSPSCFVTDSESDDDCDCSRCETHNKIRMLASSTGSAALSWGSGRVVQ